MAASSENDWIVATLGDVAAPSKARVDPADSPGDSYLGLEHVEPHTMRVLGHGVAEDVKSTKATFQAGDVLYGKLRPYLNKVARPDFAGIASTDFLVFKASEMKVEPAYLAYYLHQQWVAEEAHHLSSGVELPRIDWDKLRRLPFAYPSDLAAQQDVVRRIESALAVSDSVAEAVDSAQERLELLRQAILSAACRGRLTEQWRDGTTSSGSATELIERLRSRTGYGQKRKLESIDPTLVEELPDGWAWARLGDLIDVATGATPLRTRKDYYGGDIPWVTSGSVNAGLITEANEYITERAIKETNAKVFGSGTLLVALYGEGQTRGRVAELGIEAATNQAVAALLFTPDSEPLRPYVRMFLEQNYLAMRRLSFGGVQANLSLGVIKAMPIPLPPVDEQVAIMARLSDVMERIAHVGQELEAAAKAVDGSAQAVLASQFHKDLAVA